MTRQRIKRDGWYQTVAGHTYRIDVWVNDGSVVWQIHGSAFGGAYSDGSTWAAAARRMRDIAPGSAYEAWTTLIDDAPVPWWETARAEVGS